MLDNRIIYNFDKEWKFHLGEPEHTVGGSHADSYGMSKAGGVKGPGGMDYDDSEWRVLDLPHDYLTETEFSPDNLLSHGYKTRGNAWYRKTFKLDERLEGSHILIDFEGLAVTAEVYLNGSLMGRSFSAYAPLAIDITDRVWFGDRLNTLAVHIDGLTTEGWWYEGAGIYRHVRIYAKNPVHIAHDGMFVKPLSPLCGQINSAPDANGGNIWNTEFSVDIENSYYSECDCEIRAEVVCENDVIASDSVRLTAAADGVTTARLSVPVKNPKLWDTEEPNLYTARVSLLAGGRFADGVSDTFGYRSISTSPECGVLLNGRPLRMYGTCNHQDHAGVGCAVPDSVQDYRVRRLKELGTNAYRCSHNMPSKEILYACDRYGIVVMDENRRFEARPEVIGHAERMVLRDRNHPSVIMYSLCNEEPIHGTPTGKKIYNRMASACRRHDDSRIYTGAMSGGFFEADGGVLAMDVTGINYAVNSWEEFHKLFPNQPIVGSENNSAVTTRGCYETDRERNVLCGFDEEKVPWGQYIRETMDVWKSCPYVGGIFIWTGFDYRGEPTPFTWPSVSSQFGIMDTCGFEKDSFYINRAYFTDEPLVHIIGHWNHTAGERVRIGVVSNLPETELFLNGVSLGKKSPDKSVYETNNITEWSVCFEAGVLEAFGYDELGERVAGDSAVSTTAPARVVLEPERSFIYDSFGDAVIINVHVEDADGNIVPDASNKIEFTLSDGLKLLGVGNGDPNCHESDHLPERSLFAGRAQLILALGDKTVRPVLRADSAGLEGDEIELEVIPCEGDEVLGASYGAGINGFTATQVLDHKPDGRAVIADNDMNTLTGIDVNGGYLDRFDHGYVMYRAFFKVPKAANGANGADTALIFRRIRAAEAEFYIDGEPAASARALDDDRFVIPVALKSGTVHELRVVIKAAPGGMNGISRGVCIGVLN